MIFCFREIGLLGTVREGRGAASSPGPLLMANLLPSRSFRTLKALDYR
jgi:hypothetical protein